MTTRDAIHVTTDQLELWAFESGRTIKICPTHAELRLGSHLFIAPLPLPVADEPRVPAQREAGSGS